MSEREKEREIQLQSWLQTQSDPLGVLVDCLRTGLTTREREGDGREGETERE